MIDVATGDMSSAVCSSFPFLWALYLKNTPRERLEMVWNVHYDSWYNWFDKFYQLKVKQWPHKTHFWPLLNNSHDDYDKCPMGQNNEIIPHHTPITETTGTLIVLPKIFFCVLTYNCHIITFLCVSWNNRVKDLISHHNLILLSGFSRFSSKVKTKYYLDTGLKWGLTTFLCLLPLPRRLCFHPCRFDCLLVGRLTSVTGWHKK